MGGALSGGSWRGCRLGVAEVAQGGAENSPTPPPGPKARGRLLAQILFDLTQGKWLRPPTPHGET